MPTWRPVWALGYILTHTIMCVGSSWLMPKAAHLASMFTLHCAVLRYRTHRLDVRDTKLGRLWSRHDSNKTWKNMLLRAGDARSRTSGYTFA